MVSINNDKKEINCKIVYYGPGLGGKTTNLQVIHRKVPSKNKSDMVSLATESDRTLFFDYLPLDLGNIKGFSTKFQLYTVPGQVYYNETRKLVLRGVDGIVFVADSQLDMMQENLDSFHNLDQNLKKTGYDLGKIPMIIQYNKRDMGKVLSISELESKINIYNAPFLEAVALKGQGVFETLKAISKAVIHKYNSESSRGLTVRKFKKKTSQETEKEPVVLPPEPVEPDVIEPNVEAPHNKENVDAEIQNYILSRQSHTEPEEEQEPETLALDSFPTSEKAQENPEEKAEEKETSPLEIETSSYNDAFLELEDSSDTKNPDTEMGLSRSLGESEEKRKTQNPFLDSGSELEFDYTPDKPGYSGVSEDLDEDSAAYLDIKPYTGLNEDEKKKNDDLDFDPYGDDSNV